MHLCLGNPILQDLKTPKTGSGTDSGEVTAATWQFYGDMHEVLGARPSVEPPVLVASYVPETETTLPAVSHQESNSHRTH